MKPPSLAAALLCTLLCVGCDESTTSITVDSAAKAASDASANAAAAAEKVKDAAAEGFDAIKEHVEALYSEAVKLIEEKKFTDAKAIGDKLMALKDKLPADWQAKVSDLMRKIEDGIKAMGGK